MAFDLLKTNLSKRNHKKEDQKIIKGYQIKITYCSQIGDYEDKKKHLGYFILASNALWRGQGEVKQGNPIFNLTLRYLQTKIFKHGLSFKTHIL